MPITNSSLMKAFKFKASIIKSHRSTVACLHAKQFSQLEPENRLNSALVNRKDKDGHAPTSHTEFNLGVIFL